MNERRQLLAAPSRQMKLMPALRPINDMRDTQLPTRRKIFYFSQRRSDKQRASFFVYGPPKSCGTRHGSTTAALALECPSHEEIFINHGSHAPYGRTCDGREMGALFK